MAKTTDVGTGQVIASTWGNEIRDRTNQLFASEAERNSQWPAASAPVGASCITTDTGLRWQKVGTAWVPARGSVPIFASATERDAKWPSPVDGALCVTIDTNTKWQRISGAWKVRSPMYAGGQFNDLTIPAGTVLVPASVTISAGIAQSVNRFVMPAGVFIASLSVTMQSSPAAGTYAALFIDLYRGGSLLLRRELELQATGVWTGGTNQAMYTTLANDEIGFAMGSDATRTVMGARSAFTINRVGD